MKGYKKGERCARKIAEKRGFLEFQGIKSAIATLKFSAQISLLYFLKVKKKSQLSV